MSTALSQGHGMAFRQEYPSIGRLLNVRTAEQFAKRQVGSIRQPTEIHAEIVRPKHESLTQLSTTRTAKST
jgi:hypothetical protein